METPTEVLPVYSPAPLATTSRGHVVAVILGVAVAAGNVAGGLACSGWRRADGRRLESLVPASQSVSLGAPARR